MRFEVSPLDPAVDPVVEPCGTIWTIPKWSWSSILGAEQPELRAIDTWNAAVNDHMIAINKELGYRAVDRWVEWQWEITPK